MIKNDFVEDTCDLIDKVKEVLKEHKVTTLNSYKLKDKFYLITDFMIITYLEKDQLIDIAFHIATRPDISSFFTLILTDFNEIKDINIMEVFIKDEHGNVLTGSKCIEEHQKNVKDEIIKDFIENQIQMHYLQTSRVGEMC